MVIDVGLKRLTIIALLATVGLLPLLIIHRETADSLKFFISAQIGVWALAVQLAWTAAAIWVMMGPYIPEKWRVSGFRLLRRL